MKWRPRLQQGSRTSHTGVCQSILLPAALIKPTLRSWPLRLRTRNEGVAAQLWFDHLIYGRTYYDAQFLDSNAIFILYCYKFITMLFFLRKPTLIVSFKICKYLEKVKSFTHSWQYPFFLCQEIKHTQDVFPLWLMGKEQRKCLTKTEKRET